LSVPNVASPAASRLPGVRYGLIPRHDDARGSFRELWRAADFGDVPAAAGDLEAAPLGGPGLEPLRFRQANVSTSAAGVLRGLHLHRHQLDHWVVSAGRAFVALVDVRPLLGDTPARATVETRILGVDETVTIPAGVAHGFLAVEPLELVYFVTNPYDGSDELGFAWDDPEVAVPWPGRSGPTGGHPILSPRDAANPPLRELLGRLLG
jgi:dTDP-4-dehydrorhamnose 3,5-epimerase